MYPIHAQHHFFAASAFMRYITRTCATSYLQVWDSSIVVAKYVEKHAVRFCGRRCLDLSAGCGLVGEVAMGGGETCLDLSAGCGLVGGGTAGGLGSTLPLPLSWLWLCQ